MNIDEIMDAAQYAADAQEGWVARDGTEMEELRSKIQSAIESAVINEREACAKLCEHLSMDELTGWEFAEEIRKRSDAEESQIDDYADGVNSVLYLTPEERKKLQAAMNELRREMLDNMTLGNII